MFEVAVQAGMRTAWSGIEDYYLLKRHFFKLFSDDFYMSLSSIN